MKRRKWTSKEKFTIVLAGLKGKVSVAELCNRHQITQTQFYKWRDRLLSEGEKIFAFGGPDKEAERVIAENNKLKTIIGELTIELKKNDYSSANPL